MGHSIQQKKQDRQFKSTSAKKILSGTISEQQIKKQIMEYLTLRGIFAWVCNTGASRYMNNGKARYVKFGFPGVSDIVGVVPEKIYPCLPKTKGYNCLITGNCSVGRFFAIEVKRPGQKPTLDQQAFLTAVKESGGIAFIATSLDDVQRKFSL